MVVVVVAVVIMIMIIVIVIVGGTLYFVVPSKLLYIDYIQYSIFSKTNSNCDLEVEKVL